MRKGAFFLFGVGFLEERLLKLNLKGWRGIGKGRGWGRRFG